MHQRGGGFFNRTLFRPTGFLKHPSRFASQEQNCTHATWDSHLSMCEGWPSRNDGSHLQYVVPAHGGKVHALRERAEPVVEGDVKQQQVA